MKNKYTQKLGLAFTLVALFLASCGSNATFSKRYHNRGFNIAWGGGADASPNKPVNKKVKSAQQAQVAKANTEKQVAVTTETSGAELEGNQRQFSSFGNIMSSQKDAGQLKTKSPRNKYVKTVLTSSLQKKSQVLKAEVKSKLNSNSDGPIFGILAFVFGLFSWLALPFLFSVAAVVLGYLGLNKEMNGLAIAGLVLGGLHIVLIILAVFILLAM